MERRQAQAAARMAEREAEMDARIRAYFVALDAERAELEQAERDAVIARIDAVLRRLGRSGPIAASPSQIADQARAETSVVRLRIEELCDAELRSMTNGKRPRIVVSSTFLAQES
jgi:hypothetical protein